MVTHPLLRPDTLRSPSYLTLSGISTSQIVSGASTFDSRGVIQYATADSDPLLLSSTNAGYTWGRRCIQFTPRKHPLLPNTR